jgi:hypothetical protein
MFIRWQSRKRAIYYSYWGRKADPHSDVHWNAALIESVRVNGKPRQKHIANLCGFTEHQIKIPIQQIYVWERVIRTLDGLGKKITPKQRRQIEVALATKLGRTKPTKGEIAAQRKAIAADNERLVSELKTLMK